MARIRTHKPEFWTSEQVTDCSIEARLLFMGLLNFVDDGGRMVYSAKKIKGQIYPFDDFTSDDIQRMVNELSATTHGEPLVFLYSVDGKRYLEITGFQKHQIVQWPTFTFPDRNGVIPQAVRRPGRSGSGAVNDHSESGHSGKEGKGRERNGKESNGEEGKDARSRGSPPPRDDWPDDYREQFAAAYPQKTRMAPALEILEGVRRDGKVTWAVMSVALKSYAGKADDAYWASPANWLKEERWNDQPAKPPVAAGNGQQRRESPGDRARRLAEQVAAAEREAADSRPADAVGGAEVGGDDARCVSGAQSEQ